MRKHVLRNTGLYVFFKSGTLCGCVFSNVLLSFWCHSPECHFPCDLWELDADANACGALMATLTLMPIAMVMLMVMVRVRVRVMVIHPVTCGSANGTGFAHDNAIHPLTCGSYAPCDLWEWKFDAVHPWPVAMRITMAMPVPAAMSMQMAMATQMAMVMITTFTQWAAAPWCRSLCDLWEVEATHSVTCSNGYANGNGNANDNCDGHAIHPLTCAGLMLMIMLIVLGMPLVSDANADANRSGNTTGP